MIPHDLDPLHFAATLAALNLCALGAWVGTLPLRVVMRARLPFARRPAQAPRARPAAPRARWSNPHIEALERAVATTRTSPSTPTSTPISTATPTSPPIPAPVAQSAGEARLVARLAALRERRAAAGGLA